MKIKKYLKNKVRKVARQIIRKILLSSCIGNLIHEENIQLLKTKNLVHWSEFEHYYTMCKYRFYNDVRFRYGIKRANDIFSKAFNGFSKYAPLEGMRYLEVGCGEHNPFSIPAIMFLNGANSAIAIDKYKIINLERSAVPFLIYS